MQDIIVHGPRFGSTYRMPRGLATGSLLPLLLGLRASEYRDPLVDPASRIALVGCAETTASVGWFIRFLYLLFHRHRTLLSISRAMRLSRWMARVGSKHPAWGPEDVGNAVMAVEQSLGTSDCYPRALITSFLCMTVPLDCEVAVGILSPTTKMHAWCSVDGVVPYEPRSEHWIYSPLIVFGSC
ncbi:lasso peptide biosynthesis B2 protein [Nocardia sp. NBC_00511]|uniref:lasso peptide biosynthesis B2 protein n=1 Tax=Nocardia sp. NBC_00511 TaxID=2903591 RepID=UPI00386B05E8